MGFVTGNKCLQFVRNQDMNTHSRFLFVFFIFFPCLYFPLTVIMVYVSPDFIFPAQASLISPRHSFFLPPTQHPVFVALKLLHHCYFSTPPPLLYTLSRLSPSPQSTCEKIMCLLGDLWLTVWSTSGWLCCPSACLCYINTHSSLLGFAQSAC